MKLSIITINYNDYAGLNKTINSVIQQTFRDFEYIVIDGGSTDGSAELIKQYSDYLSYWVSEKDHGIYNAMNKGLQHAKGEYCLFLNSGDFLFKNNSLTELFKNNFNEDIVSAGCTNFNETKEWYKYPPVDISLYTFLNGSLPHPSSLIKTKLLNDLGGYRENYRIISDWCFFLEATIVKNCSYRAINMIITRFNCFGISSISQKNEEKEKIEFLKILFPRIIKDYCILENEPVANVLFFLNEKNRNGNKHIYSFLLFPFKVINSLLKLRRRLGKRMRIMRIIDLK